MQSYKCCITFIKDDKALDLSSVNWERFAKEDLDIEQRALDWSQIKSGQAKSAAGDIDIFLLDLQTPEQMKEVRENLKSLFSVEALVFFIVDKYSQYNFLELSLNRNYTYTLQRPVGRSQLLLLLEKTMLSEYQKLLLNDLKSKDELEWLNRLENLFLLTQEELLQAEKNKTAYENLLNYERDLIREQKRINEALILLSEYRDKDKKALLDEGEAKKAISQLMQKELKEKYEEIKAHEALNEYHRKVKTALMKTINEIETSPVLSKEKVKSLLNEQNTLIDQIPRRLERIMIPQKGSNQLQQLLINLGRFLERKRDLKTTRKVLLLMFGGLLVVSTYLISLPYLQPPFTYQLGEIAEEDIKVRHDIRYELPGETQKLKDEAFVKQRVVFDRNYLILENTIEEIHKELQLVFALSQEMRSASALRNRFEWLKKAKQLSNNEVKELMNTASANAVLDWAALYATLIFESYAIHGGNLADDLIESIDRSGLSVRTINTDVNQPELIWDKKRLISINDIFEPYYYSRLTQLADLKMEERISKGAQAVIKYRLLQHYFEAPYVTFNEPMTLVRKNAASESVTPIFATLRKGLILANKGDPIDSTALRQINIVNQYRSQTNFTQLSGIFLIMFVMAIAVAFFILRFSEFKFRDLSSPYHCS